MKKSTMKSAYCTFLLITACSTAAVSGTDATNHLLDQLRNNPEEQAEVLLLGTFHFNNPGKDSYKPKHEFDVHSTEGQRQIEMVLAALERFAPTKIAVEIYPDRQAKLDSLYSAYLAGDFKLTADEIYQVAFRLGKRLGHEKLYAVDARSRTFYDDLTDEQYVAHKETMQMHGLESEKWHERLMALYAHDDSLKTTVSLREYLLYLNSPDRVIAGHGHYLIGRFQLSNDEELFGPDAGIGWYVRNLRIFHNIVRLTESTEDRILVLIGAGHIPIIHHAVDASPQYQLIPVSEVLAE